MKHVPARRKDAKKDVWSAISVEKSGKRREDRAKQRQERHQNLLDMLERVLDTMNTTK